MQTRVVKRRAEDTGSLEDAESCGNVRRRHKSHDDEETKLESLPAMHLIPRVCSEHGEALEVQVYKSRQSDQHGAAVGLQQSRVGSKHSRSWSLETVSEFPVGKWGKKIHGTQDSCSVSMTVVAATHAVPVIIRFMQKFATRQQVNKALARATMSPAVTGVSAKLAAELGHHGYVIHAVARPTARAMQRFVQKMFFECKSCDLKNNATSVAARILRSFDVTANPVAYVGLRACFIVPRTDATFWLVDSAVALSKTFSSTCKKVVRTGEMVSSVDRKTVMDHTAKFQFYLGICREQHAQGMEQRARWVLWNLYDVEAFLRNAMWVNANEGTMEKPYLQYVAERYCRHAAVVEQKFLQNCASFGGEAMLRKLRHDYKMNHVQDHYNIQDIGKYQRIHVKDDNSIGCGTRSEQVMRGILIDLRSKESFTKQEIHHESALDATFLIKNPHLQRDDDCLREATLLFQKGRAHSLRMQVRTMDKTMPVYMCILLAVKQMRQHIVEIGMHSHQHVILNWLDDAKWKKCLDAGTMSWGNAVSVLNVIVFAMRFAIGSETARSVLLQGGSAQSSYDMTSSGDDWTDSLKTTTFSSSCRDSQRHLLARPVVYKKMIRSMVHSPLRRVVQMKDVSLHEKRNESCFAKQVLIKNRQERKQSYTKNRKSLQVHNKCHALDDATYMDLKGKVLGLQFADETRSTSELIGMFLDTLTCISSEMDRLDIRMMNADIMHVRSQPMQQNVELERVTTSSWFAEGLDVDNTFRWLQRVRTGLVRRVFPPTRFEGEPFIDQMVFGVYASLILDNHRVAIPASELPELFLLDASFIEKSRMVFYGQVSQATTLLIVGQRLTEMGVHSNRIREIVTSIASSSGFVAVASTETCQSRATVMASLCVSLQQVLCNVVDPSRQGQIISEIKRETSERGYPSSAIAQNIAFKWAAAIRSILVYEGTTVAVHPAFRSPRDTQRHFSSTLGLPKAAGPLSCALHSMAMELVRRTTFNMAVHAEKYRALAIRLRMSEQCHS